MSTAAKWCLVIGGGVGLCAGFYWGYNKCQDDYEEEVEREISRSKKLNKSKKRTQDE